MTRDLEAIRRRIDAVMTELRSLEEEAASVASRPEDTYPDGEVVQYKMTFPGGGTAYTYVAVKCFTAPDARRPWFLSGRRGMWLSWPELWDKISSRHAHDAWWASAWEPVEGLG